MPGTFLIKMPFNGTPGEAGFVEETGREVTTYGGITHATLVGASGDVAVLTDAANKYLRLAPSSDFLLDGEFSFGFTLRPANYNSSEPLYIGGGMWIEIDSSGNVIWWSPVGGLLLGNHELSRIPYLITRDADNIVRSFRNGVLQDSMLIDSSLGWAFEPVWIGRSASSSSTTWRGYIDDVFLVTGEAIQTANYTPTLGMPTLGGGGEPPAEGETYSAGLALRVQVVEPYAVALPLALTAADARVFESAVGAVSWSVKVVINGTDVSAMLCGELRIEAEEDAARVASLSLIPASVTQLSSFDGAPVTIDVSLVGGGYTAKRRRFTGVVETVEFEPASRLASLVCRDGYQERIRAAASADGVLALLGGLATVSPKIAQWNDDVPDPEAFFRAALGTLPGCTFIGGAGQWRVVPWHIGAPAVTYTAADLFDPGVSLTRASRTDMPSAIVASLTHTFPRLHNVELALDWEGPEYTEYVVRGIGHPSKAMVVAALDGLSGWLPKGNPTLVEPVPGSYPVSVGGSPAYYEVKYQDSMLLIDELHATLYRRWYQMVVRKFTVNIDMGGISERDESIARQIESEFDADGWEDGRKAESSLGIYIANAPPGAEDDPVPTGYEALQPPWPPANSAVDHFGDLVLADIEQAVAHVVAEATRTAAQGRRKQAVSFERPADLRLDLGVVAAVNANGLAGTGQVKSWLERYDFDDCSCVGSYTLAMPEGSGESTGFAVSLSLPLVSVTHALPVPTHGNHIGADTNTSPAWVPPDSLAGYLCNTLPTALSYDGAAPTYQTQFRIVLPEIGAAVRDPLEQTVAVSASIDLADAGLTLTF